MPMPPAAMPCCCLRARTVSPLPTRTRHDATAHFPLSPSYLWWCRLYHVPSAGTVGWSVDQVRAVAVCQAVCGPVPGCVWTCVRLCVGLCQAVCGPVSGCVWACVRLCVDLCVDLRVPSCTVLECVLVCLLL